MAFKGAVQRWRKMQARHVQALKGLFVGGIEDENKVNKFISKTITEDDADWTVANDAHETRVEDVEGAEVGDQVMVALSKDHEGLVLDAYVNEDDKVTLVAINESGASVTISQPFDINILVIK